VDGPSRAIANSQQEPAAMIAFIWHLLSWGIKVSWKERIDYKEIYISPSKTRTQVKEKFGLQPSKKT
jgi:hypothetical protein